MALRFTRATKATSSRHLHQMSTQSHANQTFILPNGHHLGYAEYGDPKGTPLLYFHGYPSCRLEAYPLHALAKKHNIRLLSLERPGFGLSTPQPGRTILDWPKTVGEFARGISLSRFAVLGTSGGGPYALACAHALPPKMLTGVGLFASGPPWAAGAHHNEMYRRAARWMSIHCPWALRWALASIVRVGVWVLNIRWVSGKIEAWLEREDKKEGEKSGDEPLAGEEKKTTAQRRMELVHSLLEEPFRQGATAAVEEARLLSDDDWGFRFEDVSYRNIKVWHGARDANAPVSMIKYMVERLPHCEYTELEHETHYTMYKHVEAVLVELCRFRADTS